MTPTIVMQNGKAQCLDALSLRGRVVSYTNVGKLDVDGTEVKSIIATIEVVLPASQLTLLQALEDDDAQVNVTLS